MSQPVYLIDVSIYIFRAYFSMPDQMVDYLALVGDSIDDVPGVPGIGAKTAAALLTEFDNLDNLYGHLNEVPNSTVRGAKRIAPRLHEYQRQVEMARQFGQLAR